MKISIQPKKISSVLALALATLFLSACGGSDDEAVELPTPIPIRPVTPAIVEPETFPENFYFGNDLSYVNEMEDCGAVYRNNGTEADVYELIAANGGNLVRVRHWNDPFWIAMIPQPESVAADRKPAYSDLEDNKETIERAKAAGMDVIFDFHFSDFWADPGRQATPRAWEALFNDQTALETAVYDYVTSVLTDLDTEGLLPEIISIGNESNGGLMTRQTLNVAVNGAGTGLDVSTSGFVEFDAARTAAMYNAGIAAVKDFGEGRADAPQVALHITINSAANGGYDWIINTLDVNDVDILGLSYYYAWHNSTAATIPEVGDIVQQLKADFPDHEVMIMETGYPWDNENIDGNGNIITDLAPEYGPATQQNQLKYMSDLVQEVGDAGGIGVIFWEPAWVSTECRTPWAQGSSHEHVAYFDHRDNNNYHIGGTWMNVDYLGGRLTTGTATTFKVDMTGADVSNGVYISGHFTFDKLQPMLYLGNNVYSYTTRLPPNSAGSYHILNGPDASMRETVPEDCVDVYDPVNRAFTITGNAPQFNSVWQSCEEFSRPTSLEVRFNVDMSGVEEEVAVITGPFNGWTLQPLTSMGDDIYSIIYTLEPGAEIEFYFRSAEDWDNAYRETVPTECALGSGGYDRLVALPDDVEAVSINVVWSSCETFEYADPPIPETTFTDVTFNVDMTGIDVTNGVWITGDFNDWTFQQLTDQDNNIYSFTTSLEAGATFAYYFLNDDDWGARETGLSGACSVAVYEGDRGFTVAENGEQVLDHIWGSCPTAVTFSVDMGATDTSNGVWIAGDINGWVLQELTDMGEGIFSITMELSRGTSYAYYFLNDDDWGAREPGLSGACSVLVYDENRGFTVANAAEQNLAHEWGVCNTDVTMNVDMTGVDVTNGVWIAGEVNGWTFQQLSNTSGDIYSISFSLPRGATYAYYFLNDDDWAARETGLSGACSVAVYEGDRGFTVSATSPQTEDHVWGSCL